MFYAVLVMAIGAFFIVLALVDFLKPRAILGKKKAQTQKDRSFVRWSIYGVVLLAVGGYGAWSVHTDPGATDESQLDWLDDVKENCDAYKHPDAGVSKADALKRNQDLLKAVQLNDIGGVFVEMTPAKTGGGSEIRLDVGKAKFYGRPVGPDSEIFSKASGFKKGDCVRVFGNSVGARAVSEEGGVCDTEYFISIVSLLKCKGR